MQVTLVKLGGSIVTRPGPAPCNTDIISRLAIELGEAGSGLILVHGTGHVGKPFAVQHGFVSDGRIPPDALHVAHDIIDSLATLNDQVRASLTNAGLDTRLFRLVDWFRADFSMRDPAQLRTALQTALDAGITPIFHGDIMPQPDGSYRVFSSDVVAEQLARLLQPKLALFLSDVDGVFAHAGKTRSTHLLQEVTPDTLDHMHLDNTDQADVSGGMGAKVSTALAIATDAERCVIANGLIAGRAAALLRGETVPCTEIRTHAHQ